jgi:hypothetical protein
MCIPTKANFRIFLYVLMFLIPLSFINKCTCIIVQSRQAMDKNDVACCQKLIAQNNSEQKHLPVETFYYCVN